MKINNYIPLLTHIHCSCSVIPQLSYPSSGTFICIAQHTILSYEYDVPLIPRHQSSDLCTIQYVTLPTYIAYEWCRKCTLVNHTKAKKRNKIKPKQKWN